MEDRRSFYSGCQSFSTINTHLFLIHLWMVTLFCQLMSVVFGPHLITLKVLVDKHTLVPQSGKSESYLFKNIESFF